MPPSPLRGLRVRVVSRGFLGGASPRRRTGLAFRRRRSRRASKKSPHCQVSAFAAGCGVGGTLRGCWLRGGRSGGGRSSGAGRRRSGGRSRPVRGGPGWRWCGLLLRGGGRAASGARRGRAARLSGGRFGAESVRDVLSVVCEGDGLFGAGGKSSECQVWGGGTFRGCWLREDRSGAYRRSGVGSRRAFGRRRPVRGRPDSGRWLGPVLRGGGCALSRWRRGCGGRFRRSGGRCSGVRGRRPLWRRRSGRCRRSGRLRGRPAAWG
ncbi:hypothetical protein VT03_11770 [Planctomyces sp. SH-PL14]|nr:hypothetical protein VT03_11770 [Planctomyces sp. SH-PL14]